ncbi:hypothetical protein [Actinoplanes subglobosus]|uniref:Uncharacterized protein n=1 Tax=Actinoplanes subglobosus TaxID=1547892 RepID=A0ABV8IKS5_9ACTN
MSDSARVRRTGRSSGGEDPMAPVAVVLGLSHEALNRQRSAGRSLSAIAESRGVRHDDLIAAIKRGLPAKAAGGRQDIDALAEQIAGASQTPSQPELGPLPGGPRGTNAGLTDGRKLDRISRLLDMDAGMVADQVTCASSLVGLLRSRGVDLSALRDVLDRRGDLVDIAV